MDIIWQLIVGLIVGIIARAILPGREPISAGWLGWLITAVIGVLGALLGTFIAKSLWRSGDENYAAGWIMSIIGAIILLLIYRFVASKLGSGSDSSTGNI